MGILRVFLQLAVGLGNVHAALNIDGSRAVAPLSKHDASSIADPMTYHPNQHDCPLPCHDLSNVYRWTPYHPVARLDRCKLPMLLHFLVPLALDDPKTDVLIRGCTLGPDSNSTSDRTIAHATSLQIDNPPQRRYDFRRPWVKGANGS